MHANTLYTILGLVASASAHVKMSTPKGWTVNNSPLEADGSDFPCKGVAYDSSVPANVMNKGESQPMQFIGSAVHGGGSCQVSLTTDLEPTKDSVWKVIKSWEGGCPAQGVDGNYPENAELEIPFEYDFEIPEDVPAGKYTLAWTWFNKIGNREMYMNCAPAEAVGDGGDESSFNALPDMFVANIDNGCTTPDSVDIEFPNPGQVVERLGSGSPSPLDKNLCPSAGDSGSGSGSGSDGGSDGGYEETAPPAESAAPSTPGEEPLPGGAHVTAPSDGAASQPTEAPEAEVPAESSAPVEAEPTPAPEEPEESAPVETEEPEESAPVEAEEPSVELPDIEAPADNSEQDGSGSGSSGSGGYEVGTECATVGSWNCVDGKSFQRCGSGVWSAVQQLSAGTECTPGEGQNIQMVRKRGSTRFGAKFLM